MTINVKGPDGSNFAFPDGTDAAVISGAMAKHYGDASADGTTAGDVARGVNNTIRSAATGVPVVGGVLNKLDAATNATLAPVVEPLMAPSASDISRPGASTEKIGDVPIPARAPGWSERYRRSLEMQNKGDEAFAAAHPIIDTAAKIAGGVGGSIPAMMAAPAAFGLTGPLPQMMTRGALSNAALSGADAAVRGENVVTPVVIGAGVGAFAPPLARAVGKGIQAVRDYRNPAPVVPQNVERVAGVDVPLTTGQATADPAVQAEEEILRRGARGSSAEAIARQADEEAKKALEEATSGIAASLDPRAVNPDAAVQALASPRTAPQAAGQLVQSELAAQEAARAAAEASAVSRVGAEGETLSRGLGGGAAPVSPFDAAESTGAAVAARRDAKVAATREAYKARDAVTGIFDESVPRGMAEDIRARLNSGENPIWVDPTNESTANKALKLIDETIGKGLFANQAAPKIAPEVVATRERAAKLADDLTAQGIPPDKARMSAARAEGIAVEDIGQVDTVPKVDLRTMDEARKRLVTMFGDAKSAAIRSGDKSDMRAMGKILSEFDNVIGDALASGKFTGDAKLAKELQDAARKSHAEYRQTFSSRGPGDETGRAVEKILGRYEDTAATPEDILKMSYGPKSNPGTGNSVKVGLRLQKVLGEKSPEYAQWKAGAFKYVDDTSLSPANRAKRLDDFLNTSWGKTILTPDDRAGISAYSRSLRGIESGAKPTTTLAKQIARISGADGSVPATVDEVTKMLTTGGGDSERLLAHLKTNLKPESWSQVRQGIFDDLINAPAGHNEYTALQKSKRLSDYLESGVSKVANTAAERAEMAKLASVFKRQVPMPGTTNPSGSATIGAKILKGTTNNLMTMLGFATHGPTGAAVGYGLDALTKAARDGRSKREAVRLFYGAQPKRATGPNSRLTAILGQAIPASQR